MSQNKWLKHCPILRLDVWDQGIDRVGSSWRAWGRILCACLPSGACWQLIAALWKHCPICLCSHGNIPECPYLLHPPQDTRVTRSRPTQFQMKLSWPLQWCYFQIRSYPEVLGPGCMTGAWGTQFNPASYRRLDLPISPVISILSQAQNPNP